MNEAIASFFLAYCATNAIEFVPVYFLIRKPLEEKAVKLVLINSITLPIVWAVFPFIPASFMVSFIGIEVLVILAETLLIGKMLQQPLLHAFQVSAVMNVLSAVLGLVLL